RLRHARLAGDHRGDLVHAGAETFGDAGAHLRPLLGRGPRPGVEGGAGGGDGGVDVVGRPLGDARDDLFGRRVEHVDRARAGGRHPGTVDVELVVGLHGGWYPL